MNQYKLNFEIDWNLIKSTHLQVEIRNLESKLKQANLSLRAYRGWKTKRVNNKLKST